jgi:hypothetical protein
LIIKWQCYFRRVLPRGKRVPAAQCTDGRDPADARLLTLDIELPVCVSYFIMQIRIAGVATTCSRYADLIIKGLL